MPKYLIWGGALIQYKKIIASGTKKDEYGYLTVMYTPTNCQLIYNSTKGGTHFGYGISACIQYPDYIGKKTGYIIHISPKWNSWASSFYIPKLKAHAYVLQFESKKEIKKISFFARNNEKALEKFNKIMEKRRNERLA